MSDENIESNGSKNEETILPGLSIIHGNHLEDLRRVAVGWIDSHPLKPLETELFIIQSNGMAQWLKLALADNDGCGISAALDLQLPGRFIWNAYRAVLGKKAIPDQSPYDKNRLTWRLVKLLPSLLDDSRFTPLKTFLEEDKEMRKRYQLACHLADLFDQYQVYRADWLEGWTAGEDVIVKGNSTKINLPEKQTWQPELWRRLQADVSLNLRENSRADLHRKFLEATKKMTCRPQELPRRVMVFGISSLPSQVLEVLHAISSFSQVLLFVHNPCRHYWADIIEDRELLRIENTRHKKKEGMPEVLDPDLMHHHANPLLAAWGKQGRDYIGLLYGYDRPEGYRESFAEIDLFDDVVPQTQKTAPTLLQEVQQAILDLTPLPASPEDKIPVAWGDNSISFHLAHSRRREVEILQDRILSFFEENSGLKPRDIIVMTPDIQAYAPHIEAVFGNIQYQDSRFIPFTIGDKPESGSQPVLSALSMLFHLPDSRLSVGEIMDLLEIPVVRGCFGVEEGDLPRLLQWIQGAGIRWGLSGDHRRDFDLPDGLEQNTWMFGLDRMLLGYAVGDGSTWQNIVPYDEVGGLEAALVGPLAAILVKLEKHRKDLSIPTNPLGWCQRIRSLVSDFFLPATSRERLTLGRVEDVLDQWLEACTDVGLEESLSLPVVREAVMGAMTNSSISQRFLAGMVNFCTLMPMRAIPFKVVCLMGMNDGEYPRSHPPLDFDLMAGPGIYRPGDRSRREDDRYLFLEALLSARNKLYISHVGRSIRDNTPRMPSVLVGQLRDYLAAGWEMAQALDGSLDESMYKPQNSLKKDLPDLLTCQHPLQPFSNSYFQAGGNPGLFTYAREWQDVQKIQSIQKNQDVKKNHGAEEDKGIAGNLATPQFEGSLQLISLIRFLKNPVQSFFNQRLKVSFDGIQPPTQDQEPFALDFMAPFGLGADLLAQGLQTLTKKGKKSVPLKEEGKETVLQAAKRLRLTGDLPMGGLGELAASKLSDPVLAMMDSYQELHAIRPHKARAQEINLPVDLEGCGCRVLEDWLDDLHMAAEDIKKPIFWPPSGELQESAGETSPQVKTSNPARWEFYPRAIMGNTGQVSNLYPFVGLWVRHLAGCSMGIQLTSFLIAPDGTARFTPLQKTEARAHLTKIMDFWWQGLSRPLAVTAKSALAYLDYILPKGGGLPDPSKEEKALAAARKAYQGDGFNSQGELGYSPYLRRIYPEFAELLTSHDPQGFVSLAELLYLPMVQALKKEV